MKKNFIAILLTGCLLILSACGEQQELADMESVMLMEIQITGSGN